MEVEQTEGGEGGGWANAAPLAGVWVATSHAGGRRAVEVDMFPPPVLALPDPRLRGGGGGREPVRAEELGQPDVGDDGDVADDPHPRGTHGRVAVAGA